MRPACLKIDLPKSCSFREWRVQDLDGDQCIHGARQPAMTYFEVFEIEISISTEMIEI